MNECLNIISDFLNFKVAVVEDIFHVMSVRMCKMFLKIHDRYVVPKLHQMSDLFSNDHFLLCLCSIKRTQLKIFYIYFKMKQMKLVASVHKLLINFYSNQIFQEWTKQVTRLKMWIICKKFDFPEFALNSKGIDGKN